MTVTADGVTKRTGIDACCVLRAASWYRLYMTQTHVFPDQGFRPISRIWHVPASAGRIRAGHAKERGNVGESSEQD